ncbi:hypothetical protein [Pseudoalteromonas luteoviolacea]|uniref:hypothetical protein n=1 Tax=Pseudoalteromonas luteoviolacea TaxID=43657 RepID=UPI00114DB09A|nr:hypothetical protein [Pseudoalteromonas luteoviolacea]TQF71791.1 hypothetical protein FLM44_12210 [Pseudoalteromonas luteoviolacea]
MTSFNSGKVTITQKNIVDASHPPIINNRKFEMNKGLIPAGSFVAENGGDLIVWDGTNGTLEGVTTEDIDTETAASGPVIEHGKVIAEHALVNGSAPTAAQAKKLKLAGIWLS